MNPQEHAHLLEEWNLMKQRTFEEREGWYNALSDREKLELANLLATDRLREVLA